MRTVFCRAVQACGEKIGTVMRTTHYSTLNPRSISQREYLQYKTLNTMTSRMHAPHTTCPGCREEVYLDRLIDGLMFRVVKLKDDFSLGIVDFDVLDGVDEFLNACERIGVRGSAGVETRVYLPEFAAREINSPGEPGVYYHMGIGFTSSGAPAGAAGILAGMRDRAARRNREMMARVNAYLDPVTIDYERDVLPLTPAGNATERHMLVAYMRAAEAAYSRDSGIRGRKETEGAAWPSGAPSRSTGSAWPMTTDRTSRDAYARSA